MKLQAWIISDVVCPWCYIGKKNWEKAILSFLSKNPDVELSVEMKPFRLDPSLPSEGVPRDAVLAAKFGGKERMLSIFQRTLEAAKAAGIEMRFDPGVTQPNTIHCHRLIRLARDYSLQSEMSEALFFAYFVENQNLAEESLLNQIALGVGIPEEKLREFWDTQMYLREVMNEEENIRDMGVTGVPFFLINEKYAFSGAQPPEVMEEILGRVLSGNVDAK